MPNFEKTYQNSRNSVQKWITSAKILQKTHSLSQTTEFFNQTENNSNFDSSWDLNCKNWDVYMPRDVCLFWLLREKLWFDKKRRAKIPSFHKPTKNSENFTFLDRFLCLGRTRNWWNLWRGFASGRRRRPWRRRLGNRGEFFAEKMRKISSK